MKPRITAYVSDQIAEALDVLATRPGVSKSDIIEAAIESYLSDGSSGPDSVHTRRLDYMSEQLSALDRDLAVQREVLSLFIRYMLTVTPDLDPKMRKDRTQRSKERFDLFVLQVAKHIAGGGNLVTRVLEALEGNDQSDLEADHE